MNYRVGPDEIDLLCREGSTLVIAEVKTRTTPRHGAPENAVGIRKQRFLARAASRLVGRFPGIAEMRFDLVSVVLEGSSEPVRHIPDAFYPPPGGGRSNKEGKMLD